MKTISLNCSVCNINFTRALKQYTYQKKISGDNYKQLCGSKDCKSKLKFKQVQVSCFTCKKEFSRALSSLDKNGRNYCSMSCSAKINNSLRLNSGKTKIINCKYCPNQITLNGYSKREICDTCKGRKIPRKIKNGNCINCGGHITFVESKKYCNSCRLQFYTTIGKINGKISAASQKRRSKNEIYFYELCSKYFTNVTSNEQFFESKYGKWDADVILHDQKTAILWNGVWHYKQVNKRHSVSQVQARDKIKYDIIISNGYSPYIIKDMGKYNKKFVDQQFSIFKEWLDAQLFIGSGI